MGLPSMLFRAVSLVISGDNWDIDIDHVIMDESYICRGSSHKSCPSARMLGLSEFTEVLCPAGYRAHEKAA